MLQVQDSVDALALVGRTKTRISFSPFAGFSLTREWAVEQANKISAGSGGCAVPSVFLPNAAPKPLHKKVIVVRLLGALLWSVSPPKLDIRAATDGHRVGVLENSRRDVRMFRGKPLRQE